MVNTLSNSVGVVILAAGKGKRMGSDSNSPKVLQPVLDKPLIKHLLENIGESKINTKPVIVIAPDLYIIRDTLGPAYEYAIQESQLGTGHAVLSAKDKLSKYSNVLVLYGDHPLVTSQTIDALVSTHLDTQADMTFATVRIPNFVGVYAPLENYGRIIRDRQGRIIKNVEYKDASEEEMAVVELNPGFYVFKTSWLWQSLPKISRDNAQNEYYLTDLFEIAFNDRIKMSEVSLKDAVEVLGVNTPEQLSLVESIMKQKLNEEAKDYTGKLPI